MRRIKKDTPLFLNNIDLEDVFISYGYMFPKGKQPTEANITSDKEVGIDLSKLDSMEDKVLTLRAQFLPVKVWYVETEEEVTKMLAYIKDAKYVCFDLETTSIQEPELPSILLWSITIKANESFVVPFMFNKQMLEYFTTTEQTVVAYNLNFDGTIIRHHGGNYPKNFEDPYLYNRCLYNDTVLTPPISLKAMVKDQFGYWADADVKSNIANLTEDVINDNGMLYYSGVDSIALHYELNKNIAKIEKEKSVDIFDLYPTEHPKKRSYSREFFYKNVLLPLLPLAAEFTHNGLPLDIDRVHALDGELDSILGKADTEVLLLPTVIDCWTKFKEDKARAKVKKYKESVDVNEVKIYKPTNQQYINLFVQTMYHDKVLPSKAKNWTPTVIGTFDDVLALAIKSKNLEGLRVVSKYSDTFIEVETVLHADKVSSKALKAEETASNIYSKAILDLEFKPLTSSQQKKYIFNEGFGVSAYNKSMTTGEDSFNKEELDRLVKTLPKGTELYKFVELCIVYSGGNIIKKNFVKNFLAYTTDKGRIHSNFGLARAKSMRPTGGGTGSINLLNLPSSRSVFSKPIKRCIKAPEGFVWMTADYSFLEVAANANIAQDETLLNVLLEDRDAHCENSAAYYKDEIESILGPNDGTVEWNSKYKEATKTNSRLDTLRSNSKQITFALTYMAGVPGLYKAVGYLGDTFDDVIKVKDYKYTTDLATMVDKSGREYSVGKKDGVWKDVSDYKNLDNKYHEFFEKAVLPAATMHNTFHNVLYSGNREYRENIILPQVKKHKDFHMGMGAYINQTKKLSGGSIRTLWNTHAQVFSILTLIAFEKFRLQAVKEGKDSGIQAVASVYDSVYFLVKKDKDLIEWSAEVLERIMTEDFLEDQKVKLKAEVEVSLDSWADFVQVNDIQDLESYLKGQ